MAELEYHPAASNEVVQAFDVYREVDHEVAERFKVELDRAEKLVERSPEAWAPYLHGTKGFRLRGFPFVISYGVRNSRIFVVAVAHTRRRPGYWRDRLDD